MKFKKSLLGVSTMVLLTGMFTSCGSKPNVSKVAMITDYGDITDQSFNQTTHEAAKAWCEANGSTYKYYRPAGDSTAQRVASVNEAIAEGFTTIVMPGYAFAGTIEEVAIKKSYPNVTFVALDVSKGDLLEAHYSDYDYNPDNEKWKDYKLPSNVYCAVYHEEISGFFAGYAAVKEGYRKLGFCGGMAVPAVQRFGYGFAQGASKAADEISDIAEGGIDLQFAYAGTFGPDAKIVTEMEGWYGSKGTEVVFSCGGGIYLSVAEAAKNKGDTKKIIGVDSDQSFAINGTAEGKFGEGRCITSAMKALSPTVKDTLTSIKEGKFEGGKIDTLGLISEDNSKNYVALPTDTWSMKNFKVDDYKELVKKVYNKTITVSNDTTKKVTEIVGSKVTATVKESNIV